MINTNRTKLSPLPVYTTAKWRMWLLWRDNPRRIPSAQPWSFPWTASREVSCQVVNYLFNEVHLNIKIDSPTDCPECCGSKVLLLATNSTLSCFAFSRLELRKIKLFVFCGCETFESLMIFTRHWTLSLHKAQRMISFGYPDISPLTLELAGVR